MKVSVIAIPHHSLSNLFLHGKRKSNGKWSLPGGKAEEGESAAACAHRELEEETGIKDIKLTSWGRKDIKRGEKIVQVTLFIGKKPENLILDAKEDPDEEFSSFKFLDPTKCDDLHVPWERNILKDYLSGCTKS